MDGRAVWNFAVEELPRLVIDVLAKADVKIESLDLIVPHQANRNIVDEAMKRLGIPENKAFLNIQKYGNTMSASVAIAFSEAREESRIRGGMTVLLAGFGAGLTSGGMLLRM